MDEAADERDPLFLNADDDSSSDGKATANIERSFVDRFPITLSSVEVRISVGLTIGCSGWLSVNGLLVWNLFDCQEYGLQIHKWIDAEILTSKVV